MRRHLSVAWGLACVGLAVGMVWAHQQATPLWPYLNQLALYRKSALGWSIGFACGLGVSWLMSRRSHGAPPVTMSFWRSAGRVTVMTLALAPVWLGPSGLVSGSLIRESLTPRRQWGDTRPNIILITIDALRADHVGAHGIQKGLTPELDSFASEGTVYESAYATAPWTLSSLGSLFTLLPASKCGIKAPVSQSRKGLRVDEWYWQEAVLATDVPVLSERLKSLGYFTVSELTNPFLAKRHGWTRGFILSHYEDGLEPVAGQPLHKPRGEDVTGYALPWLIQHRREPFFLWVHYMDTHVPYCPPTAPPALQRRYDTVKPSEMHYTTDIRTVLLNPACLEAYKRLLPALYAEEVKYIDSSVGKLLEGIRKAGLWDNSLIVVTADHGEELLDHGGVGHGHSMHNEVLAVPLIVKWPAGVVADRRITQTVELPSVAATFLKWAGGSLPTDTSVQYLPMHNGQQGACVFSEAPLYGPEQTALTTDQWRIIYHPTERSAQKQFEVYDRVKDPAEHHDLSSTAAAQELRQQLQCLTKASAVIQNRRIKAKTRKSRPSPLTEETQRQLRSLGYLR